MKVNVVLMRGLLGWYYSRGMDELGSKLAKLENVDYVTVEDYYRWRNIRKRLNAWMQPTVLIGHSFGANAAVKIANKLRKDTPLVVTVDPSQFFSVTLLSSGVEKPSNKIKKLLNFYQTRSTIGSVEIAGDQVENIEVKDANHVSIDDKRSVHERIIEEISKL